MLEGQWTSYFFTSSTHSKGGFCCIFSPVKKSKYPRDLGICLVPQQQHGIAFNNLWVIWQEPPLGSEPSRVCVPWAFIAGSEPRRSACALHLLTLNMGTSTKHFHIYPKYFPYSCVFRKKLPWNIVGCLMPFAECMKLLLLFWWYFCWIFLNQHKK